MPAFTSETARLAGAKGVAAKKARKLAGLLTPNLPADPNESAPDRNLRLWSLIAAMDKRIAREVERDKPNGELIRDLCTARKTLQSQADGPEPVKDEPNGKAAPPLLADPVPVQE